MWIFFNIMFVLGGGLAMTPIFLVGLGTADNPPTLAFTLVIVAFSFFSGLFLSYHDVVINGNKWVAPSISVSPFGAGKKLQNIYLSSVSLIVTGVGCVVFGGEGHRIEWMGALPILIGTGLLASAVTAGKIFLEK